MGGAGARGGLGTSESAPAVATKLPLNALKGLPGFKIGHLNIRSLTHKIEHLRMDLPTSGLDVFTLSETWLNTTTEDKLLTVTGYQLARADRQVKLPNGQTKKGGGLGIYYKNNLTVDTITHTNLGYSNSNLELQWATVDRPHAKKILIGNIYRPPEGNLNEAIELIEQAIKQIPNVTKYEILLLGDFNNDYTKRTTANPLKQFAASLEPTRIAANTSKTIDLAFTNIKYCTKAGTLNYNISDHKPIYVIKKKPRNNNETSEHWGRTYRNYNTNEVTNTLISNDRTRALNTKDPNDCWAILQDWTQKAADKHCPLIKMDIRNKSAEYITNELIELQKDRDYFKQKADQTNDPGDIFIAKCMIRKARSEIRKAKSRYYKDQIDKNKQNPKKFWRTIEKIEPDAKPVISNLYYENTGNPIPEHLLAEEINNFFVDIGENLAKKIGNASNSKAQDIEENDQHFDLTEVSQQEIITKIKKLSPYKSSGLKDLSSTLVKTTMIALAPEFTHLYNLIINTGIYPDCWKTAVVTPIPKTRTPRTCNELRPISILPLPGKVIEQILHDQIKSFLESTNYLTDCQNGFRKDRSTTKALASLMDELLTNMDNGDLTIAVFLDFKKAFDTIDHHILMTKIEKAGLGQKTKSFLTNYLSNRMQYTRINGTESNLRLVKTGVPQGSTLGPLLFLIFINDLPLTSDMVTFTLFADDTVLTIHNKHLEQAAETMQKTLSKIATWCKTNKLTLNASKTEYVVYGTKIRKARAPRISLQIGDAPIREVDSYGYLGTTLDSTLTAGQQLNRLNQSLAPKLTTFRKMRDYISENTALLLYKVTILPIIDYSDVIYNLLTQQQESKLQRIQNRALRTVYKGRILNTQTMHDLAKLDPLKTRRNTHQLTLMYKRAKDPQYIDQTKRTTRAAKGILLKVPRSATTKLAKAPIVMGSTMWNNLPHKIRNSHTYVGFKMAVRKHLAEQTQS